MQLQNASIHSFYRNLTIFTDITKLKICWIQRFLMDKKICYALTDIIRTCPCNDPIRLWDENFTFTLYCAVWIDILKIGKRLIVSLSFLFCFVFPLCFRTHHWNSFDKKHRRFIFMMTNRLLEEGGNNSFYFLTNMGHCCYGTCLIIPFRHSHWT